MHNGVYNRNNGYFKMTYQDIIVTSELYKGKFPNNMQL